MAVPAELIEEHYRNYFPSLHKYPERYRHLFFQDPGNAPNHLAYFAYENVQYFILEKIAELAYPELTIKRGTNTSAEELSWTGDAINIIEIAYGIWLTGQLNNGNATLAQIVRWLETNLKVTIGNIQSRFAEISARKRLSPTKFIDQMKDAILNRINNSNA